MTTILEQLNRICNEGDGDIFCPDCGTEIHQFYHWIVVANHIEHDRCPMCACEEDNGTYEWCDLCKTPCAERIELERQWDYENHLCNEADIRRKYG